MSHESKATRKTATRREFLKGLAMVGGGAVLAACAPREIEKIVEVPVQQTVEVEVEVERTVEVEKEVVVEVTSAVAPPETIRLRVSVWGDVPDLASYLDITESFNAKFPNVVAAPEQYPGWYYDKVIANFAAGIPADLTYVQCWAWQRWVDADLFYSLDDYIAADGVEYLWPDLQFFKNNSEWRGHTYMSHVDSGSVVMYYNKDLFDKQGVPYPTDDWTYEDFQGLVEALTFEEDGVKYYGYAQAQGWMGNSGRSIHWMRMNGALEYDTIVEPKEARFTDPEIVDALQFTIYDVIANGWCPSPDTIQGGGVGFAQGRCAMVMEGPWALVQMWGEKALQDPGLNYDTIAPPWGTRGDFDTQMSSEGHLITKAAEHPDETWELLKFIAGDEGAARIAAGGRMPGIPSMIEKHWVPLVEEEYNFTNAQVFVDAMNAPGAHGFLIHGEGASFEELSAPDIGLNDAWVNMYGLQMTAQESMEWLNPRVQEKLDAYWAKQ